MKKNILGAWRLIDFKLISDNGTETEWAEDAYGTLMYTPDHFMSVSMNGKRNGEPVFLFYSGEYVVCENNIIKHKVINATDLDLINQTMTRTANYSNEILTLAASGGKYGAAVLRWEKYK